MFANHDCHILLTETGVNINSPTYKTMLPHHKRPRDDTAVLNLQHELHWLFNISNEIDSTEESESEWGFYALSASKAIFGARTYNCITYSVW